ncbi:hypothetical protein [Dactylosporangium sp. CS-033363]|uniref:hypothetical protein n=1 Tax=Dactylosporangium sp. CS-033363 TaxID=3239935 RepID=UPI003D93D583
MDIEKRLFEDAESFAEEVKKGFDATALLTRIAERLGIEPEASISKIPPGNGLKRAGLSVDQTR